MEEKPMKTKHISKTKPTTKDTQNRVSRTKMVRKCLAGRPESTDLTRAIQYGESLLGAALLLSNRLNEVNSDASTEVIRRTLLIAQSNFKAFCGRVRAQQGGLPMSPTL
jgi:hypothetical protein